ncbi:alpha/beta fold hydrolase [Cellulomonas sp. S1-8]|uniref:alpha/beta fold hydrolase n=1 Tax=Cellulomonas sp. S1-8 TaxID=2904790 RepID=UPI002244ACF2|nr:alpha/beta fold hydrolase [Cellulomonas sp. S1-8]UZN01612.1 alpha/beta fold hydrolase [Cellulomonas sp. S1-8]
MSTSAAGTLSSTTVGESGAPVVFLHGLFGQGRNFAQIAKALAPEYRSLLLDLPDHGRSAWTDRFDYTTTADLVADHLRAGAAADGPVHVVGHSMGGKVAMVLALRHPELVGRLVVADIAPAAGGSVGEFAHLLDSLAAVDLTTLARRGEADERLAARIPDARVRGFLLQNLRADGDGGFRWQANLDLLRRDLAAVGGFPDVGEATFDHPVLWVAGDRSDYVRPEHDPAMRRLFPRTTLVTLKGAGHWVHSEQPEAFVSALRTFLGADGR